MHIEDRFYTSRETADILGTEPRVLQQRRMRSGSTTLPFVQEGNEVRYHGSDIRQYIAQRDAPKIKVIRTRQRR